MNFPYLHLVLMFINLYCAVAFNNSFSFLNYFGAGFALATALECFVQKRLENNDKS